MMYGCLNALLTFPSTYKDLMGDALSHVKWKEGGEATRATRQRLNERKREVRRRAGVERESAYCQVEWDGVSSVTGNSEDEITSHLCSASLPPSHILSQKLTDASERRQIAVRRAKSKSAAFHASCHRGSSAARRNHEAEPAAEMSPTH